MALSLTENIAAIIAMEYSNDDDEPNRLNLETFGMQKLIENLFGFSDLVLQLFWFIGTEPR